MKNIFADKIIMGKDVIISESAVIRGLHGNAKQIVIGDHTYIGENVQIICDDFAIGEYSKVHHHTNIHGYKPCKIGHNAWIGQYSIIDSIGGTTIGNNCGIGAHSQLWSHIKFGDTLEGCRFNSYKSLRIGNDVWFVGHCIVSPINAEDKSMAMVGSVVTQDMLENNIYAGVPAKNLTEKMGTQFIERPLFDKIRKMNEYLAEFPGSKSSIKIVESISDIKDNGLSYFAVKERKYFKTNSEAEKNFMNFLLPEKAKYTPINSEIENYLKI